MTAIIRWIEEYSVVRIYGTFYGNRSLTNKPPSTSALGWQKYWTDICAKVRNTAVYVAGLMILLLPRRSLFGTPSWLTLYFGVNKSVVVVFSSRIFIQAVVLLQISYLRSRSGTCLF